MIFVREGNLLYKSFWPRLALARVELARYFRGLITRAALVCDRSVGSRSQHKSQFLWCDRRRLQDKECYQKQETCKGPLVQSIHSSYQIETRNLSLIGKRFPIGNYIRNSLYYGYQRVYGQPWFSIGYVALCGSPVISWFCVVFLVFIRYIRMVTLVLRIAIIP